MNCGGSYINSPDWIKKKKVITNLRNKYDHRCVQYTAKAALNCKENGENLQRISKIDPFIDNYNNWQE